MISNKTIEAYKKAVQNINKAIEKEIDSFEMNYDKICHGFLIFFGDEKCNCTIIKHDDEYKYDIKIYGSNNKTIYLGEFKISEHTGKAIIYKVVQLNI